MKRVLKIFRFRSNFHRLFVRELKKEKKSGENNAEKELG